MPWKINQFEQVFTEFYAGCDTELKAQIDGRLDVLSDLGNAAREPYSKFVQDGIFECRAKTIRHQARLLFCFLPGKNIVIVLCVIKKKSKLDRADIREAIRRKEIVQAQQEKDSGLYRPH